ncbi:DMT family transporter [Halocalculus aciditolerans]|uniref:Membrane protein n=1 Tax=Halocalculus aciditolerans TaxID=1383812 RepID=A0A830FIH4_9EURY|nr:DMT family transporter [Halocalculus aciditolerans]GGL58351.1 membrane protein [Halocalculus aciditolerans]
MPRSLTSTAGPLAAAGLWGGMYVVSVYGFRTVPPVTLAFARVDVAAVVLYALVSLRTPDREFTRDDWRRFAALALWVAVTLVLQFVGTARTNASQGALLTVLTPVFTVVLGVLVLDESLTVRRVAGIALAAVGTFVVLAGQYDLTRIPTASLLGVAALVASAFTWAGYTVYGADLVRTYSALETATYSAIIAVPLLALAAAAELALTPASLDGLRLTLVNVAVVCYLGVAATAAAWTFWYAGFDTYDAGALAAFFFLQPAVGALLGALFLDESLGALFVAGAIPMALGVYLASTSRE